MRLANGWKWSHRRLRIEVFYAGQRIGWQSWGEARDPQCRGAFRHLIADLLVEAGASVEHAASFATQPVRQIPSYLR